MGTRFRTLLAPVGVSTGDGRRFAEGGISLAETPFPLEWARAREGGHDGAVPVGAIRDTFTGTVFEAVQNGYISQEQAAGMNPDMIGVWAVGELYDDIDRELMPRLAEDVAEFMHLVGQGTLGPSVDLDTFEAVAVMAGSNEPLTEAMFDLHTRAMGEEPKVELLVTAGRVRAATAVSIPAFAETSRPFELIPNETARDEAEMLALVASLGVQERALPQIAAFSRALDGPTPITYDFETGQVYGHIATWQTCHAGYSDVCITAPRSQDEYRSFNRFPVETVDGVVWAGRITAGGRHAGLSLAADATMREYDSKSTVAWVRAYEDEHGIAVAGVLTAEVGEGEKAILSRRKVSGDWRETAAGLSLLEVLALSPGPRAHSEPGFPVETFSRSGRQVALVASLGPDPESFFVQDPLRVAATQQPTPADAAALAAAVVDEMQRRSERSAAVRSLAEQVREDAQQVRARFAVALEG